MVKYFPTVTSSIFHKNDVLHLCTVGKYRSQTTQMHSVSKKHHLCW